MHRRWRNFATGRKFESSNTHVTGLPQGTFNAAISYSAGEQSRLVREVTPAAAINGIIRRGWGLSLSRFGGPDEKTPKSAARAIGLRA
jgi:hypothetical protein